MILFFFCKTVFVTLLLNLVMLCFVYVRTVGIKVTGKDTTAIYGENATLFCHLTETNDHLTKIIWKKKTKETPTGNPFFAIGPGDQTKQSNGLGDRVKFIGSFAEKNGSIQLHRMRILDEGIYTCTFNLFPSGTTETDINLTVFARPVQNVENEEPVAGYLETTLASCFASAWPVASVTWRLGDLKGSLRTETNHTVNDNGTITVASYLLGVPLKHFNKKDVQCVVKHISMKEDLVLNYTINIHYPPQSVVIIPDSPTYPKEFKCEVDSNPKPTNYIWSKQNGRTPYHEGNKLPVPELTPDFNGLYICNASNKYGSSLGSLYVNVHTESNTVCWGLFGFVISCAVFAAAVGAVIFKYKPECIPALQRSKNRKQDGDQEEGVEEHLEDTNEGL